MAVPLPLILKGKLLIGAVDVSNECFAFKISATVDTVEIPATFAGPKAQRGGAAQYQIEIAYMATDGTDGALFPALWAAVGTASKELTFSANFRDGANSVTNPNYAGTFIVSGAEIGGAAETLSEGSATFPLIAAPTVVTV